MRENVTVGLCCCSAETDGQADSSLEFHGEFMSRISLIFLSNSASFFVVKLCSVCARLFWMGKRQIVTESASNFFQSM